MSGIIFNRTRNLDIVKNFYTDKIGMEVWLDQGECVIFKDENLLLGFCESDEVDKDGTITFFYDDKEKVDEVYSELSEVAVSDPEKNEDFMIYHFYGEDPEGRKVEFQTFLHPLNPYTSGLELLEGRRSVREYKDKEVPRDTFWRVIETARFSPSSKNSEPYYFKVIDKEKNLSRLADIRGDSSSPISETPMAVAICSDPNESNRFKVDATIATYHFMLSAFSHGLGTCWIADMNRNSVKEILNIPEKHYVATVTPLGYPDEKPDPPERSSAGELVKFLDK